MSEISLLLRVDEKGNLFIPDLKRQNGKVIIPRTEWENAINYAINLDNINSMYLDFLSLVKET